MERTPIARKKNVNKLLELIKDKKDTHSITQILAMFSYITGISSFTVYDYFTVLKVSGIITIDKGRNKVIKVTELKEIDTHH